jgi:hypothetical protein
VAAAVEGAEEVGKGTEEEEVEARGAPEVRATARAKETARAGLEVRARVARAAAAEAAALVPAAAAVVAVTRREEEEEVEARGKAAEERGRQSRRRLRWPSASSSRLRPRRSRPCLLAARRLVVLPRPAGCVPACPSMGRRRSARGRRLVRAAELWRMGGGGGGRRGRGGGAAAAAAFVTRGAPRPLMPW